MVDLNAMEIQKAGVIGAGTMGIGVTHALAEAHFLAVLVDTSEEALNMAKARICQAIRLQPLLRPAASPMNVDQILARITFTTDITLLGDVDFVIENVTENWQIKQGVYHKIDAICRSHVIFGVNTSAIPITRVASITNRPQQVIGMHFMNPVPLTPLVEVIRAKQTSDITLARTGQLLSQMGKEWIVVQDSPGFVTNRVMMLTVNEAIALLHEGVSTPRDIDKLFKKCFGHKMGPLETADLIGLDTVLFSLDVLYEHLGDEKFVAAPLLRDMVKSGLLGRKNGQGFYQY